MLISSLNIIIWYTTGTGGWDGNDISGRPQEIGTYMYVVQMLCDGINETYSGALILLR